MCRLTARPRTFIHRAFLVAPRPHYPPHATCADSVVVVNADKVKFPGRKLEQKIFHWHTGHPGGVKQRTMGQILNGRFPERVLEKDVERMLPKERPLARKQLPQLKIYNGGEHPHAAQNPETIAFADLNAKNVRSA